MSFKIFNRKFIHAYPATGLELSIHKSIQFQQNQNKNNTQQFSQQHQSSKNVVQIFSKIQPQHQQPSPSASPGNVADEDGEEDGDQEENGKNNTTADGVTSSFLSKYFRIKKSKLNKHYSKFNRSILINFMKVKRVHNHDEVLTSSSKLETSPLSSNSNSEQIKQLPANQQTKFQQQNDIQFKLINEIVSLECVDILKLEFCLNGGRCFLYPILNHSLSSCECAEGFMGERCEAKSYEFIPRSRPRLFLAKTVGGPLVYGLAAVDLLFLLFLFCKNYNRD